MTGGQRTALVTGASRGIGRAISLALGQEGVCVLVAARGIGACREVADTIRSAGGAAEALELDVADPEAPSALTGSGPIDWLINNAGIAESAPLGRSDEELYERHMRVNFHGARRLAQALLPGMRERGHGRIVNLASSAGLRGYPYVAAYCASKFALVGWTLAAAAELSGSGVSVSAVCPHYVDSPMLDAAVARVQETTGKSEEDVRAFFARANPGGRLVDPGQVAEAVLDLLASGESGCLVELDGARMIRQHPNDPRRAARR